MKKIGIFWENFEYGGVETYLTTLINNEKFKNYEFTVITNSSNKVIKNFKKKIKRKNFTIILYRSINQIIIKNFLIKLFFFILKPIFFLLSIFQIYFLLRNRKFDIFISQCGGFGDFRTDFASIIIAKILRYPIRTAVIHHCYTKPKMWSRTINIINYFIAKLCTSLIFVSKATFKNIKTKTLILKNKKIFSEIINNGINLDQVKKINYFKKTDKNVIRAIVLSRIEHNKGHVDLIDSFKYLPSNLKKKIKIYFVGRGNSEFIKSMKIKILNNKLYDNFVFTGFIAKDSREIISNFDVLISPTRDFEGFGLSIAESLSVGVPVISTKVGGVMDYLNKKNSILIKPRNPKLIANSLKLFIKNRVRYKNMALQGKKLIKKSFSADLMSKKYIYHFAKMEIKNV